MGTEKIMAALVFADVKGYSNLTEHQFPPFALEVLQPMGRVISEATPAYVNTWGDAVVVVFKEPLAAARFALSLRDLFRQTNWPSKHLPADLDLRVALHAGVLFLGDDPIRGETGILGTQVNLAARIEPITRAGQVWATSQFVTLLEQCADKTIAYDDLGERPLAKQWGSERLFRIRRSAEPKDNKVVEVDLPAQARFDGVNSALRILKESGNDTQKVFALELLGESADSRAVAPLIQVLKDRESSALLRNRAAASLGALGIRNCVPDLVDLVMDKTDDIDVRDTVIIALGKLKDVRAGDALLKVAANEVPMPAVTRARAISTLGSMGEPRFVPELVKLASETPQEEIVYQAIAMFFSKVSDMRGVPILMKIARDKEKHVEQTRGSALESAIAIAPDAVVDDLIAITKDDDEGDRLKNVACQGLAKARTPRATARLQEIGSEPSNSLAVIALALLMNPGKFLERSS